MVVPGRVQNGVVVLHIEAHLAQGQEASVVLPPLPARTEQRGSPAALLAALDKAPKVPAEWVDELESLIAAGKRPPSPPIEFADDPAHRENS